MPRIKILRIIARLNIGGPAIHTVLLTQGLDRNKFESMLVCGAVSPGEGDMAYYAKEKGVQPIYIPELRREINPFKDVVALVKIVRIIKKEKPNIIHTHTAKAGTLGRLAGMCSNYLQRLLRPFGARNDNRGEPCVDAIRFFHTFHGHVFDGYFNCFLSKMFILIEKILALFTDKIITVSEEVRKELISLGIANADKIAVIPLGFELEKFLAITQNEKKETIDIGIVGRLVPIKNHWLFLEAARMLRLSLVHEAKPFKVKFFIVGDGELRQELEEFSRRLTIEDCVEFTGWQKDVVKVYSELDIICLTSLNEGTPVSLIEAMASGKAVISTDVGGVRDLLGQDRGVVVDSNNVEAFSMGLLSLLTDADLRKRLGKKAREFVRERFNNQRLLKDIEELYLNI